MFDRYDGDSSGYIGRSELHKLCVSLGKDLTPTELDQAMAVLSTDRSGYLSLEDFLWWWDLGLNFSALFEPKARWERIREQRWTATPAEGFKLQLNWIPSERGNERWTSSAHSMNEYLDEDADSTSVTRASSDGAPVTKELLWISEMRARSISDGAPSELERARSAVPTPPRTAKMPKSLADQFAAVQRL